MPDLMNHGLILKQKGVSLYRFYAYRFSLFYSQKAKLHLTEAKGQKQNLNNKTEQELPYAFPGYVGYFGIVRLLDKTLVKLELNHYIPAM